MNADKDHQMIEEAVRERARKTAALFHDEFPGELIDGNWDGEAWAMDSADMELDDEELVDDDGLDTLWPIYSEALHAEVARLNATATRCQCGDERCTWVGDAADLVKVRYLPESWRGTPDAVDQEELWKLLRVTPQCADMLSRELTDEGPGKLGSEKWFEVLP